MKAIHCRIAGIIVSAFVSHAGAADHQKGIKMLIDAASRHHRSPGSAANVEPDDKQRGIKTLIEAATASRHLRPLSKEIGRVEGDGGAGSKADGNDSMDRTLRDLSSAAIAAKESAAPKPARGPAGTSGASGTSVPAVNAGVGTEVTRGSPASEAGPSPGLAAMHNGVTGAGGASVLGVNAGAVGTGARTPAVAVSLANARRNRIASQDLSAVTGVPSLPGRGSLNGTGMGRPTPAIGGAAINSNAGRLNGAAVRSKH